MPAVTNLGELVRALRVGMGITQRQLAQLAQLSEPTIRNLEAGRNRPTAEPLARLLAVPCMRNLPILAPSYGVDLTLQELISSLLQQPSTGRTSPKNRQHSGTDGNNDGNTLPVFSRLTEAEHVVLFGLRAGLIYIRIPVGGLYLYGPCSPTVPLDQTPRQSMHSVARLLNLALVRNQPATEQPSWIPAPYRMLVLTLLGFRVCPP